MLASDASDAVVRAAFAELVDAHPLDAASRASFAHVLAGVGDQREALVQAHRALELGPGDYLVALDVTRLLIKLGNLEVAEGLLDEAGEVVGDGPLSAIALWWYVRAMLREAQGDLPGAISSLEEAVARDPSDPDVLANLARLRAV